MFLIYLYRFVHVHAEFTNLACMFELLRKISSSEEKYSYKLVKPRGCVSCMASPMPGKSVILEFMRQQTVIKQKVIGLKDKSREKVKLLTLIYQYTMEI